MYAMSCAWCIAHGKDLKYAHHPRIKFWRQYLARSKKIWFQIICRAWQESTRQTLAVRTHHQLGCGCGPISPIYCEVLFAMHFQRSLPWAGRCRVLLAHFAVRRTFAVSVAWSLSWAMILPCAYSIFAVWCIFAVHWAALLTTLLSMPSVGARQRCGDTLQTYL
jgi:hypothetical protein